MTSLISRIRGAVKREHAEQYLLLMLLSFAASVTATRLFLQITGYPQLGSRELHIAHVLWGGLLLFLAALLPLVVANRWAYTVGALAGGIGAGLFIDEVGKFITQSNDYFYPFAAPIIYAFFLLIVLLYLRVRRPASRDPRAELYRALDGLMEVLDHDLDPGERADLEARLEGVAAGSPYVDHQRLAAALLNFFRSEAVPIVPDRPTVWERIQGGLAAVEGWLGRRRWKAALGVGMAAFGLLAGGRLIVSLLALFLPGMLERLALDLLTRETLVRGATSLTWYLVRMSLEGLVGALLLAGSLLMPFRYERIGVRLGGYGLLIALTTVNLLVFYFDQFGTIATSAVQFALLVGLLRYQRRYLSAPAEESLPPGAEPSP